MLNKKIELIQVEMNKRNMDQPDWNKVGFILDVTEMNKEMIDAYCQNLWKLGLEQRLYNKVSKV